jgi:hypothetical protein
VPLQIRRGSGALLYAIVSTLNALRRTVALAAGQFHLEVTATTTGDFTTPAALAATFASPPASDLPSLLRLCTEIATRHTQHTRDGFAHVAPDGANALASGAPMTLPAALAFLNDAKAKYDAHLAQAGVHVVADPNRITAPDATDLQTAMDLANTYRALFNAHILGAPAGASIQLIDP